MFPKKNCGQRYRAVRAFGALLLDMSCLGLNVFADRL